MIVSENKAQDLYDQLWWEVVERANARGLKAPDETKIFQVLVRAVRDSMIEGDPSAPYFLEQLKEVRSVVERAKEDLLKEQFAEEQKVITEF